MFRALWFAAALVAAWPAAALELTSGVSRTVVIPPQSAETLFADFSFVVPPGATWVAIESTAVDPSQDIDLFARFSLPVAADDGETAADFASETPGTASEQIVVNSATTPPLQTGRWHIALRVRELNVEIRAVVKATVDLGGEVRSFVISTFDDGDEGWTRNFPPVDLPGATTGDPASVPTVDPAGFLRITDLASDVHRDFVAAPGKFLGDLASLGSATLSFRLRHISGSPPVFRVELRLIGERSAFVWRGPVPMQGVWENFEAPLTTAEWTRLTGEDSFEDALRNVQRIEVGMDHNAGAESNDLDDFTLTATPREPPLPGDAAPGLSDFETGTDGWSRNFPASTIRGASVGTQAARVRRGLGGRDSAGFLMLLDGGGAVLDSAVAPPRFVAGLARLERPWYEFYFRRLQGAPPRSGVTLRLIGGGAVFRWRGAFPRSDWARFRVPIDRRNWVREQGESDFDAMLREVERLEIGMDLAPGFEVYGLDDFYLRTEFTPPVGRALGLDRERVVVEASAGGDAVVEPLAITSTGGESVWRARIEPPETPWLSLDPAEGETPAEIQLTFSPAGLAPGVFEAAVVIDAEEFGVAARRVEAELTVVPAGPRISAGGVGSAADPRLPIAPGGLGALFGEFLTVADRSESAGLDESGLPVELAGARARLLDADAQPVADAPLLFAGPRQINFQLPFEAAAAAFIVVARDGAESSPEPLAAAPRAPAVFTLGEGLAAAINADGSVNAADRRAAPGSHVTVFFTGLGEVDPALESGRPAPIDILRLPTEPIEVEIDGAAAEVLGVALTPGFVGLAQASARIAADLGSGRRSVRLRAGEQASNALDIWIE